jgi:hypothetical protein
MLCASSDGDRYRSPGIASVADMTGDLIAGGVKDRSGKCGGNREVPARKPKRYGDVAGLCRFL